MIVSWLVHRVTFLKRWSSVVFRVFPNHDVFMLFFCTPFHCFFASLFFLWKYSPKIGVRIIHGCALCTYKYGIWYNLLKNLCLNFLISTWNLHAKHLKEWNLCKPTQVFFFFLKKPCLFCQKMITIRSDFYWLWKIYLSRQRHFVLNNNAQKGNFACFTMPNGRESDIIFSHNDIIFRYIFLWGNDRMICATLQEFNIRSHSLMHGIEN